VKDGIQRGCSVGDFDLEIVDDYFSHAHPLNQNC
jgi:hypothetical protein